MFQATVLSSLVEIGFQVVYGSKFLPVFNDMEKYSLHDILAVFYIRKIVFSKNHQRYIVMLKQKLHRHIIVTQNIM